MRKWMISLLKYVAGVSIFLALMVAVRLCAPNGEVEVELTTTQLYLIVAGSVVLIAAALKIAFENR